MLKQYCRAIAACMAGTALTLFAAPVLAFDWYDPYDYYDVGYNYDYDDDWFYDYYDYGPEYYDPYYDYYSQYDYDMDLFDWEEDGLFE